MKTSPALKKCLTEISNSLKTEAGKVKLEDWPAVRACHDLLWREIVDEWALEAEKLGVCLLMETVPHKTSNERYVPAWEIIDFVRTYPFNVMKICLDINHSNLNEKLTNVISVVNERLFSLHVPDNDGHIQSAIGCLDRGLSTTESYSMPSNHGDLQDRLF